MRAGKTFGFILPLLLCAGASSAADTLVDAQTLDMKTLNGHMVKDLHYSPAVTPAPVSADLEASPATVEQALYDLIKGPSDPASSERNALGTLDLPGRGEFYLYRGASWASMFAEGLRDKNWELNNPDFRNFVERPEAEKGTFYYIYPRKYLWMSSEYLVDRQPSLIKTGFVIALHPLANNGTHLEIFEAGAIVLAGTKMIMNPHTIKLETGYDIRSGLAPTMRDQLDLLDFLKEKAKNTKAVTTPLLPDAVQKAEENWKAVEENIRPANLHFDAASFRSGTPVKFSFDLVNQSEKDITLPATGLQGMISIRYAWEPVSGSAKETPVPKGLLHEGDSVAAGNCQHIPKGTVIHGKVVSPVSDEYWLRPPFGGPFAPGEYIFHVTLESARGADKARHDITAHFTVTE